MNIVDKLIEYKNTRDVMVLGELPMVGTENLIVIVTEILSWLKLERKREIWQEQGRKTKNKPLELNMNYPWCNDLVKIMETDNQFSAVFSIEKNSLMFKDCLSDEYIREARSLAYEKYNPQMIIG